MQKALSATKEEGKEEVFTDSHLMLSKHARYFYVSY